MIELIEIMADDGKSDFYLTSCTREERTLAMQLASAELGWNYGEADFTVWAQCLPREQFIAARSSAGSFNIFEILDSISLIFFR